jgi:hypothetical protein
MTTTDIQRRIQLAKKKTEMMEKYDKLLSGKVKLSDILLKESSKYPESPDWCALCQRELDTTFEHHLQVIHGVTIYKVLDSPYYIIDNNPLIDEGIIRDLDREMR